MALTGRAALLAAVAVLVVGVVAPSWTGVALVTLLVLALIALDVAVPASAGGVALSRDGDTSLRLGGAATVALTVTNTPRPRLCGLARDA